MSCSHRRRTQSLRTLCHFAQHHHALRIRERRPFSACFCLLLCAVGKSIYIYHHRGALERAIGETSSRFCVRIQFRIYLSVIAYHRHERPVRRTGRPAKRAGTHRGTIVARKDDVLPMVREETGFLDDAFLLVFFFLFPNVFLSLSH